MNELLIADAHLQTARDNHEREYKAQVDKLNNEQSNLVERLATLDKNKLETAQAYGNPDAVDDDLVEINAGGKLIAARRSTLTQIKGSRLEALFSGRWDKKLQIDNDGRIFLDVNPVCFQAICDFLNEMTISSEDNPPDPPRVDEEHELILKQQLCLFGLKPEVEFPDSNIIKDARSVTQLHDWLGEDGVDGDFNLLYRSSRDGSSGEAFHSKCDGKGCTVTIIETNSGSVVGGYTNTPWTNDGYDHTSDKAFLFLLSATPCKMRLKDPNDPSAVGHYSAYGPMFGHGRDLYVNGSKLFVNSGHSYQSGAMATVRTTARVGVDGGVDVKEIEVFRICSNLSRSESSTNHASDEGGQTDVFSIEVNKAVNEKIMCLQRAESEISSLEDSFKDERDFIAAFASGDTKDIIMLNVSGTMMATTRPTLCTIDSVLAQQFDDTKWTEQGCNGPRVKEWVPNDVASWAENIEGIQEDVGSIFKDNNVNGCELLALDKDGLLMLGIKRAGTLCLLLKEIKKLEKAGQDVVTLIEHSPYCFGKIVDYLRLKRLQCQGLADEASVPKVCNYQQSRFEKVVKYYFPGENAKELIRG